MGFGTKLLIVLYYIWEAIIQIITNSLQFTRFGPKKFTNHPKSMSGKVVVITGSNTGIGKVTARVMAELGAKVIMACRDIGKASVAANDIRKGAKHANIVIKKLDLSSLASVRQCAKEINQEVDKIDILINNAGVMWTPKWVTEDGFEMQFGTNHLGHFLFTLLLVNKLRLSSSARIVNLSSIAHMLGEINFDDINSEKNYDKMAAYSQSKLANVLFTRELAKKLSDTNVRVYCLHPGLIETQLYEHAKEFHLKAAHIFVNWFGIDAELGAQTTLYCALEESIAGETGRYYTNCHRVDHMVPNATDDLTARKLWQLSCDLVKIDEKFRL